MAATPSGKDKILRYTRVLADGYDISGDFRTFSQLDNEFGQVDMWGASDAVHNFYADGQRMVGVRGLQVLLNDATAGAFTQLKAAGNTNRIVTVAFGGGGEPAVPDPAYVMQGIDFSALQGIDAGAINMTTDLIPKANLAHYNPMGYVLANMSLVSSTFNGASVDLGAAVTANWQANLHVTDTATGCTLRIEHSSDDSAFSTLGTFSADGSSLLGERLSGAGASINRYVRFALAAIGGGTLSGLVSFSIEITA